MAWPSHVFIYFETADNQAADNASFLAEGGRTWEIDNIWSVRLDPPHHPKMSQHLHILQRGNDVCVINRDGTPSHNTTQDSVPNWVMKNIRARRLIEQSALLESVSASEVARFTVPTGVIEGAARRAKIFDMLDSITPNRRRLISFRDFLRRR